MICVSGFVVSLLPALPEGLLYWIAGTFVAGLYSLIAHGPLKANRAEYEFRLLHWFPLGIFVAWMILQLLDTRFYFTHILTLGFLFLWSLPLVTLGIALLILFALHVIRRSAVRVTFLSLLLVLFIGGAVAAEAMNYNDNLQAALFPPSTQLMTTIKNAARRAVAYIRPASNSGSSPIVAVVTSSASSSQSNVQMTASSSSKAVALMSSSRATALSSSAAMMLQSSSSIAAASSSKMMAQLSSSAAMMASSSSAHSVPPVVAATVPPPRPGHLPNSGPESFAVILATLVGLYSGILHIRARKRMDIM
jgi:hypothetical protein